MRFGKPVPALILTCVPFFLILLAAALVITWPARSLVLVR
jgi:hypothetical protein